MARDFCGWAPWHTILQNRPILPRRQPVAWPGSTPTAMAHTSIMNMTMNMNMTKAAGLRVGIVMTMTMTATTTMTTRAMVMDTIITTMLHTQASDA